MLIECDRPDDTEVLRCRVQTATWPTDLGELTTAIAELNDVLDRWNRVGARYWTGASLDPREAYYALYWPLVKLAVNVTSPRTTAGAGCAGPSCS